MEPENSIASEQPRSIQEKLFSKKGIFLGVFVILFLLPFLFYWFFPKKIQQQPIVSQNNSPYGVIKETPFTRYISFYQKGEPFFSSKKESIDAVHDFFDQNIEYQKGKHIFPDDFKNQVTLTKDIKDWEDPFLIQEKKLFSKEHFSFEQNIEGIPVYGGTIMVHVQDKNKIYSVLGSFIANRNLPAKKISDEEAKKTAVKQASFDLPEKDLTVGEVKHYVINKQILGVSSDEGNYNTFAVTISSFRTKKPYSKRFFVDLVSGGIVFTENLVLDASKREVQLCDDKKNCEIKRAEGDKVLGNPQIDNLYDALGNTYAYFSSTFSRDSFDAAGASQVGQFLDYGCNNAFWLFDHIEVCKGFIAEDVVGHEFTHGVVQTTAGLVGTPQAATLNESIADIFGSALDNNWTIGENTVAGAFRNMEDPTKTGGPDRLFSSNYDCAPQGAHLNAGVTNKTFYLIAQGGTFNGCNIQGIGREKAGKIMYRALTVYLNSTANFKTLFTAINAACSDLYKSDGNTCGQVEKAMQSTEIDQQPDNNQNGAACLSVTPKKPLCASTTPPLTTAPTSPTVVPSISVTPVPTGNLSSCASFKRESCTPFGITALPSNSSGCYESNQIYICGTYPNQIQCLWTSQQCNQKQGVCSNGDGYNCYKYCDDLANAYGGSTKTQYRNECLQNYCQNVNASCPTNSQICADNSCPAPSVCDKDHVCVTKINGVTPQPGSGNSPSGPVLVTPPAGTGESKNTYICEFVEDQQGKDQIQMKTLRCSPQQ